MQKKRSRASIADIAEACGVSKITVSRAVRGEPGVAEATRQRILRVAENINYLAPAYGSGKSRGHVSVKKYYILFQKEASLHSVFFGEIIRTIQQELFDNGKSCALGIVEDDYGEFLKLFNILQTDNIGGVFVVGPVADKPINVLLESFGNVILVDNPGGHGTSRPCSAVFYENSYGSALATRHLLGLGRKRILLICGPEGNYFSRAMVDGYMRALAENGTAVDQQLIRRGDFHAGGGFDAVREALDAGVEFDAIHSNDEMACGAIRALREAGVSVPGQVGIVGFDNLPIGEAVSPSLTTIDVDREKLGRRAVELLLRLEQETETELVFERIGFLPQLLIRESCGWKQQPKLDGRTAPLSPHYSPDTCGKH